MGQFWQLVATVISTLANGLVLTPLLSQITEMDALAGSVLRKRGNCS